MAIRRNLIDFSAVAILHIAFAVSIFLLGSGSAQAFQEPKEGGGGAAVDDSLEKVKADQEKLSEKYKQLEDKLYSLYEFEKSNNPERSKLLARAFQQSQEKMTASQLALVVNLMNKAKYKDAETEQAVALGQLTELLQLLQSEDASKAKREEIKRFQEYAKEVDRILRIQKGLRGQTEGGVDQERLAKSQSKNADRTGELSKEMKQSESNETDSATDEKDGNEGDSSESGESKPGESKAGESKAGESKPGESKPGEGQSGEGQSGEGQSGEGQSGEGQKSPQSDAEKVQKKIEAAKKKMDDAKKALDDAKRENAVDAMRQAEKELEEAKRELEEILRQLREEEIEQTLAMLEDRFREMLEKQMRVYEATNKLNKLPVETRGTEFEIASGKLGNQQSAIAADAGRALLLLREDGSSIAFPVTVEELQQDMIQVANRLTNAKVNAITIEIEEDILESLNFVIEALVKTQEDMEKMKEAKPQKGGQGKPGDQALIDQLAEIKMLKGLQQRILRRHDRYAKFLDDPNDPVGATTDPDVAEALQRLADRQAQLTQITRELVNEKNK